MHQTDGILYRVVEIHRSAIGHTHHQIQSADIGGQGIDIRNDTVGVAGIDCRHVAAVGLFSLHQGNGEAEPVQQISGPVDSELLAQGEEMEQAGLGKLRKVEAGHGKLFGFFGTIFHHGLVNAQPCFAVGRLEGGHDVGEALGDFGFLPPQPGERPLAVIRTMTWRRSVGMAKRSTRPAWVRRSTKPVVAGVVWPMSEASLPILRDSFTERKPSSV